jgi:polyisoprenyl-phosphate glycosyltransferase
MYSLIIPVYRNEASLHELAAGLDRLAGRLEGALEVVFVVDGSPDASVEVLRNRLPQSPFQARLIEHSRNFGSFAAIRTGLEHAQGQHLAVMAADLQDPPEVVEKMFSVLRADQADVVVAVRATRSDPLVSRWASVLFWTLYRRLVQPNVPKGGVDLFGCSRVVRDHLLRLRETNTSLVGLLFWIGFRRVEVSYDRLERRHGKSGWTLSRKWRYFLDSLFAFSDLPINLMIFLGAGGVVVSIVLGAVILVARIQHLIAVPGYAATALIIMFFGGLNSLGMGVLGSYLWRAFENTKGRPAAMVMSLRDFQGSRSR